MLYLNLTNGWTRHARKRRDGWLKLGLGTELSFCSVHKIDSLMLEAPPTNFMVGVVWFPLLPFNSMLFWPVVYWYLVDKCETFKPMPAPVFQPIAVSPKFQHLPFRSNPWPLSLEWQVSACRQPRSQAHDKGGNRKPLWIYIRIAISFCT